MGPARCGVRVARRSDGEAPKVVTPYGSKLEKWRDKYRAGYAPRPAAPEKFGEKAARPFRFTRAIARVL